MAAIHAVGVKVLGGVTDGSGKGTMSSILSTKAGRAAHAKALVQLATANHYDGIDLDYEGFAFPTAARPGPRPARAGWPSSRQLSTSCTQGHDAERRGAGDVRLQPRQHQRLLGLRLQGHRPLRRPVADHDLRLQRSRPGAIAPISWVRRVLDYATSLVPAGKIQVGVPAYGRDWPQVTSDCPIGNPPATTA